MLVVKRHNQRPCKFATLRLHSRWASLTLGYLGQQNPMAQRLYASASEELYQSDADFYEVSITSTQDLTTDARCLIVPIEGNVIDYHGYGTDEEIQIRHLYVPGDVFMGGANIMPTNSLARLMVMQGKEPRWWRKFPALNAVVVDATIDNLDEFKQRMLRSRKIADIPADQRMLVVPKEIYEARSFGFIGAYLGLSRNTIHLQRRKQPKGWLENLRNQAKTKLQLMEQYRVK